MSRDNDQRLYLSERWVPENSFWKFALEQWASPPLRQSLLAAQDDFSMRVSIYLLSGWLAVNKRQLHYDALIKDESLAVWQIELVDVLRHCRKQLIGTGVNYDKMKASIQSAELMAEQWEISQLYQQHLNFSEAVDKTMSEVLLLNILSYTEGKYQQTDPPCGDPLPVIIDIAKGFAGSWGIEIEQITLDNWVSQLQRSVRKKE